MTTETPDQGEHLENLPECPICYFSYDNIFKTPLLLPCLHTFCMECLSRLCLFLKQSQDFPCPLCRTLAHIPHGGVPNMQPNLDIVAQFPPAMQDLQEVWVEGHKLCWVRNISDQSIGSMVTLHLLPNPAENQSRPEGLVSIRQNSFLYGCQALWGSMWGLGLTILIIGLLLFSVIFVPVYLTRK